MVAAMSGRWGEDTRVLSALELLVVLVEARDMACLGFFVSEGNSREDIRGLEVEDRSGKIR